MQSTPLSLIASILNTSCENRDTFVAGYAIDSRRVKSGDLFFALRGATHDGHMFLSDVQKQGATSAVVDLTYTGPSYGLILLRVADVGEALRLLAREMLQRHPVFVIAVTGSVGKTTTKDFIATLLSAQYLVHKTEASFNSKLTLPLVVLNRNGKEDVLLLEMGASEPGDIARLVEIAPPDLAVITKIGLSHVANFPQGIVAVGREKGMIFSHRKTKCAIFERTFAPFSHEVVCAKIQSSPEDAHFLRPFFPFSMHHLWENFLLAYHVAIYMKIAPAQINEQMRYLSLPKMRCEQFEKGGVFYFFDAYNANPESMKAALTSFANRKGRKIAVLGSMKELGPFSDAEHRKIGRLATEIVDRLFVLGKEAKPLYEAVLETGIGATYFEDLQELTACLKQELQMGDSVLIKGSRSMQMEKILEGM